MTGLPILALGYTPSEWFAFVEQQFGEQSAATIVADSLHVEAVAGMGTTHPTTYTDLAALASASVALIACGIEQLEIAGWLVREHRPTVYTLAIPNRVEVNA